MSRLEVLRRLLEFIIHAYSIPFLADEEADKHKKPTLIAG